MKKGNLLKTLHYPRQTSLSSLEHFTPASFTLDQLESADIIRKLQNFETKESTFAFLSKLKSDSKRKTHSNNFNVSKQGNDTTTASDLSLASPGLANCSRIKIEKKPDALKPGEKKANLVFNFNRFSEVDTLTHRAIKIQENATPTQKRLRTKSEAVLPMKEIERQVLPALMAKGDKGTSPKHTKYEKAFIKNLALDPNKVLNILNRRGKKKISYVKNAPRKLEADPGPNKMENNVQEFVRKHFSEDAKQRIQTFEKFSFNHSERDENRVVLNVLNEIKNPREPPGSMFVTDLWSKDQQRECMEKASLVKEKLYVEKYLYYKTKDKNKTNKDQTLKVLPLYSSKDEKCYKDLLEMKQNSIEHQNSMAKRESQLIVMTPLKVNQQENKKRNEEQKLQGIFDSIVKLNSENSKDLKYLKILNPKS